MVKKNNERYDKVVRIVLAIFAAVALWIYVNGSSIDLISRDIETIPVTLVNEEELDSKGLTLKNNETYYVNLRVRGTEAALAAIDPSEITAQVDLNTIDTSGDFTPKVEIQGLSNSVILDEIKPKTLTLSVDQYTDKNFDVSVNTNGKPADGVSIVSATTGVQVTADGSAENLSKIDTVVATAHVQGLSMNSQQYVDVNAYDSDGNILPDIDISPKTVPVDITVGQVKEVKVMPPSTTGNVANGYKVTNVSVSPDKVTIGGTQDVLEKISELTAESVDVNGATSSQTKEVNLNQLDGVVLMDGESTVKVTVTIEELSEKNFSVDVIETKNLDSGLKILKMNNSSVSVRVKGTTSELNEMKGTDIKAWVDLKGLTKGETDVNLQVKVPAGTVVSISPKKTTVTIE